jgi:hypothetical protein
MFLFILLILWYCSFCLFPAVIARMTSQDAQCSVILTTHSMEEAEALCSRIGVSKYHSLLILCLLVLIIFWYSRQVKTL